MEKKNNQFPETLEVKLYAKYFKNSDFDSNTNCPLAQAIKEQFANLIGSKIAYVMTYQVEIDEEFWNIMANKPSVLYKIPKRYENSKYTEDYQNAKACEFSETEVIRIVTLTKHNQ